MISLTRVSKSVASLMALIVIGCMAGCGGGIGSSNRASQMSEITPSQPVQDLSQTSQVEPLSAEVDDESSRSIGITALGKGPAPVNLGTALDYVILSKTGITNVPTSSITGNLGVSPIASTAITGFSLVLDSTGQFSTSSQVTGKVFAANYRVPTPSKLTTAVNDMQTAYVNAAGRVNPDHVNLASGNIGGLTLLPGLYKWSGAVDILGDVTLKGGLNDVWIFQVAGGVNLASARRVILKDGAAAKNIFWQVAGVVSMGTTSHMEGQVLAKTNVTMKAGASANGRLLAQTAVTLISNKIVKK